MPITINLERAKAVAHNIRRSQRNEALAPLDQAIALAIPGTDVVQVEAEREGIRRTNATVQANIDAAESVDDLKNILDLE